MIKKILLLGDERLYDVSKEISFEEIDLVKQTVDNLHDTLMDFRKRHGLGRAIAAPQIGVFKRLIYMNTGEPFAFINPRLEFPADEKMVVLDDCMSFPGLFVNVKRYVKCIIHYKDLDWKDCSLELKDDLSELLQHEYDHLDGILATMRAISNKSFVMKER